MTQTSERGIELSIFGQEMTKRRKKSDLQNLRRPQHALIGNKVMAWIKKSLLPPETPANFCTSSKFFYSVRSRRVIIRIGTYPPYKMYRTDVYNTGTIRNHNTLSHHTPVAGDGTAEDF